jgi:hypothetical protein
MMFCAAVSAGVFALAALADERWPDRLDRRGHRLLGQPWRGIWGAQPRYERRVERKSLAPAAVKSP